MKNGYIAVEDLSRGKITEKVNRETIAAAKFSVVKKYKEQKEKVAPKPKASGAKTGGTRRSR